MGLTLLGKPLLDGLSIYGRPVTSSGDALGFPILVFSSSGDVTLQITGYSSSYSTGYGFSLQRWFLSGDAASRALGAGAISTILSCLGISCSLSEMEGPLLIRIETQGTSGSETWARGEVALRRLLSGATVSITDASGSVLARHTLQGTSTSGMEAEGLLGAIYDIFGFSDTLSEGLAVIEQILKMLGESSSATDGRAEVIKRLLFAGNGDTSSEGFSEAPLVYVVLDGASSTDTVTEGQFTLYCPITGYSLTLSRSGGTIGHIALLRNTALQVRTRSIVSSLEIRNLPCLVQNRETILSANARSLAMEVLTA